VTYVLEVKILRPSQGLQAYGRSRN